MAGQGGRKHGADEEVTFTEISTDLSATASETNLP